MAILTNEVKQKLNNYKPQFLRVFPNTGIKIVNEEIVPMTDAEWVDEVVKNWLKQQLKRGERLLQSDLITSGNYEDLI